MKRNNLAVADDVEVGQLSIERTVREIGDELVPVQDFLEDSGDPRRIAMQKRVDDLLDRISRVSEALMDARLEGKILPAEDGPGFCLVRMPTLVKAEE